eukprot:3421445-Prymnesium_polylepis.1
MARAPYPKYGTRPPPPHTARAAPRGCDCVIARAFRKACGGGGSQSLTISGESGAGKTESTK